MHLVRRKTRKKLWEIDGHFHCGIIGTCLTLAELRKLYRKTWNKDTRHVSDYDIHTAFVGSASQPIPPSRLVQRLLESKYRRTVDRYCRLSGSDALAQEWRVDSDKGQVPAAFWAVASHCDASSELLREIHGEVHMLSHLAGASQRADLRRLAALEDERRELSARLSRQAESHAQRIRGKEDQITALTRELREAQARGRALEKELHTARDRATDMLAPASAARAQNTDRTITQLTVRAEQAERQASEWMSLAKRAGDEIMQLKAEADRTASERQALEAQVMALLEDEACESCPTAIAEQCPRLNGRCILYVGGITRQMPHFRALVEKHGGQFVHHDGGLHQGHAKLNSTMARADAIMCALDLVSHDASLRVKRFCKKYAKPLVMLPSTGLAPFTRGLHEVAGPLSFSAVENGADA
ncbi:MAG: DUF2325 domain-containing protein [Gammaproteobacteria bacterium]|nr:DUF2325 domain-containing protein [Gammaproteobacteria bacterium]